MVTLALLLSLLSQVRGAPNVLDVTQTLTLENGLDRGTWGNVDLCPLGSFAFAFEIKFAELGHLDDTALTGIRLYCGDFNGSPTGTVSSSEATYGEWQGPRQCASGKYLKSMRGQVVPEQGEFGDDLGLYDAQMSCSDGQVLDGLELSARLPLKSNKQQQLRVTEDGRVVEVVHLKTGLREGRVKLVGDGVWSLWAECSGTSRICGLQTRVEPDETFTDDAGVCDLIMFCCSY
ncbi:vitelline membrane outer layer protein 1-like [Procambarus clarkii]|uniref:vitelline membrane outer layer protein 1 n=1 Tax=Procambarus clarkii TaxID=6728 RepID=UPI001E671B85|nr:vitelline membrane outer layer protein 1-like [Procambarus clarkii]